MRVIVATVLLPLMLLGCSSPGVRDLNNNRLDYNQAVHDTEGKELLLNIVRARYHYQPTFMAVREIESAVEIGVEGQRERQSLTVAGLQEGEQSDFLDKTLRYFIGGVYVTKPIVRLEPLTAAEHQAKAMKPLALEQLAQLSGLDSAQGSWVIWRGAFVPIALTSQQQQHVAAFEQACQLDRCRLHIADDEIALHYADATPQTITLRSDTFRTRSFLGAMRYFSQGVEPAGRDGRDGVVLAAETSTVPFVVHSYRTAPTDPYLSVRFRDHAFFIDNRDTMSKQAFQYLRELYNLSQA